VIRGRAPTGPDMNGISGIGNSSTSSVGGFGGISSMALIRPKQTERYPTPAGSRGLWDGGGSSGIGIKWQRRTNIIQNPALSTSSESNVQALGRSRLLGHSHSPPLLLIGWTMSMGGGSSSSGASVVNLR
jgi:hypothetical protein